MTTVETLYQTIAESNLFILDGPEIDLPEALTALASAVAADDRDACELDEIGEHDMAGGLWGVLVGGYWSMTEWHGGQWSPEYAALCAIGQVYSPGCEGTPEPETCEHVAYEAFNAYFEE